MVSMKQPTSSSAAMRTHLERSRKRYRSLLESRVEGE